MPYSVKTIPLSFAQKSPVHIKKQLNFHFDEYHLQWVETRHLFGELFKHFD